MKKAFPCGIKYVIPFRSVSLLGASHTCLGIGSLVSFFFLVFSSFDRLISAAKAQEMMPKVKARQKPHLRNTSSHYLEAPLVTLS
ncbi:MAG: hypothetical protein M2R45_05216 [Verrucomicrobia subdivision 3 bacterium]|nr:hypothetical protein [Limisphaerales bacterium]MCS1413880.1 hypothetical protein [Limisphaerales bacterium]